VEGQCNLKAVRLEPYGSQNEPPSTSQEWATMNREMLPSDPNGVECFTSFFESTGRSTMSTNGTLWYSLAPGLFQSFPYHRTHPSEALRKLATNPKFLAARVALQPNHLAPTGAIWVRPAAYSVGDLTRNARSKVARGAKRCSVERIDFRIAEVEGLRLAASTAARQGVPFRKRGQARWAMTCRAAGDHGSFEAWGTYVESQLVAVAICFRVENCYQISTVRSDAQALDAYPNNFMLHSILEASSQMKGVEVVCYGLASLDQKTTGLESFKASVGFDRIAIADVVACRQAVMLGVRASNQLQRYVGKSGHRSEQVKHGLSLAANWRELVGKSESAMLHTSQ
jgi:hypothetical protein